MQFVKITLHTSNTTEEQMQKKPQTSQLQWPPYTSYTGLYSVLGLAEGGTWAQSCPILMTADVTKLKHTSGTSWPCAELAVQQRPQGKCSNTVPPPHKGVHISAGKKLFQFCFWHRIWEHYSKQLVFASENKNWSNLQRDQVTINHPGLKPLSVPGHPCRLFGAAGVL